MEVLVNYPAVLLAAVASMVVGFLWYSPLLFAKPWMKLMGYTAKSMEAAKKNMGKTYFISFLTALVTACVLAHIIVIGEYYFNADGISTGLQAAFWSWLGFTMTVQLTDVLFGNKSTNLFLINTGYQLASLLVMGAILGYFG